MPHIKFTAPSEPAKGDKPFVAWFCVLEVDGRKVPDLVNVDISAHLGDAVRVTAQVLATEQFLFEGDADLHVTVVAPTGFRVVEETLGNGKRRYTTVPR